MGRSERAKSVTGDYNQQYEETAGVFTDSRREHYIKRTRLMKDKGMRPDYTADAINALTKELKLLRKDIQKLSSETRTNTYQSGWVCAECGHSLAWGAIICECGKTDPKLVRR